MGTLKGKTALVTGSTSGIGLGIAQAMAAEGANVMLNGFGEAKEIEQIRQKIEKEYGVKALYNAADMTKPGQIRDMVKEAQDRLGSVDVLVNNAGIQFVKAVDEYPEEKWDAIIAINLSSVFHATKAALPAMKTGKWGRIINIASAHGLVASPFKGAYVAAKHGVVGFTKTVALETAQQGITCNSICPGYVNTPLVQGQIKDQAKSYGMSEAEVVEKVMLEAQAIKQFTEIDQIGALAVFLCSDAARTITGIALPIDGGWTAK